MKLGYLIESSLADLYQSAVDAFPQTRMRQHATHTIKIANLRWTPFVGMKTLFIRGLAQNEGREYNPIILLKGIDYQGKGVVITASDGIRYQFRKPSLEHTDVSIRCNCADYRFRFSYYNHLDKSLYGRKPPKYESKGVGPPANPLELPGLCKHLIKMSQVLRESGIFVAI